MSDSLRPHGESHGQRSLEGYSPWGRKESDTSEATSQACLPFSVMTNNRGRQDSQGVARICFGRDEFQMPHQYPHDDVGWAGGCPTLSSKKGWAGDRIWESLPKARHPGM